MDIVYTLKDRYNGEELRYSLRSLGNVPHDKVFFVGGCPKWAANIIHIPTKQTGTKYKNTTNNLKIACKDQRLSENFIYMNDDFFILEPIKTQELIYNNGTVQSVLDIKLKKYPLGNPYFNGMAQTKDFLQELGISDPLSYELHIPFIFNKNKFLKMYEITGVKEIPCFHKRTVYGNLYLKGGEFMKDVKIFMDSKFQPNELGKFLSCDDSGFQKIGHFLNNKFPTKSKYEV